MILLADAVPTVTLEQLIQSYGYLALFIGTLLEGETIVVIAGFAAHQGYLELPWVMFWAFLGTVISDQAFFYLGYFRGRRFIVSRAKWRARARRVQRLLDKYQILIVLGFRFLYGIRNITPFVIGSTGFSRLRFAILNFIGAVIWAVSVSALGYACGELVKKFLADVKRYERWVLAGLLLAGITAWTIKTLRDRRLAREALARNNHENNKKDTAVTEPNDSPRATAL